MLIYFRNLKITSFSSVFATGAKFGLRLMLNVEQYENIPVYNQNTGIKVNQSHFAFGINYD